MNNFFLVWTGFLSLQVKVECLMFHPTANNVNANMHTRKLEVNISM